MEHLRLAEGEYRFARIVWEHEPLPSGKLVELSQQELGWKKSTTYTVIRRLSERGVVKLENAVVTALVSREQVQRSESREFIDRAFNGSLPQFIAAFASGKKLSRQEAEEIRRLIDAYEEECP